MCLDIIQAHDAYFFWEKISFESLNEDADAESILKLIELKTVAKKTGKRFATTCEIRKSANKPLAEIIGAENFVISSNIGGLMSVQCAGKF